MPLIKLVHPFEHCRFGLWQISEDESYFESKLPLSDVEKSELAPIKGIRRLEWWAARWLLHLITGEKQRLPLAKDAFSKPFFPNQNHLLCSLSHSQGIVGAMLLEIPNSDEAIQCGCDIQVETSKMTRIAPRFLHLTEQEWVQQQNASEQPDLLHLFWTAKESVYKAHGIKLLDFSDHIRVSQFQWDADTMSGSSKGAILKPGFEQSFTLFHEKSPLENGELFWTVCINRHPL